jgi:hypothetical protein
VKSFNKKEEINKRKQNKENNRLIIKPGNNCNNLISGTCADSNIQEKKL